MAVMARGEAIERLAGAVERIQPEDIPGLYSELHPYKPVPTGLSAAKMAAFVRNKLTEGEIADLWQFLFPQDRNIWYNEETDEVHYNEEQLSAID
jgi:hypothetical protein